MVQCFFNEPKKWGPHVWYILDLMVVRLDPDDQVLTNHIMMQIVSLMETIPCDKCRDHYKAYMRNNPIEKSLTNRMELARWLYALKSEINKRENKKNISFQNYLRNLKTSFNCDIEQNIPNPVQIYSTL